ncbi:MAG: transglycosylase SLT domain-containing protein [Burkholderiales bacterium]|nr:transglycosylase SLT domain-containing protein [Burkholderiales bacterium]
MLRDIQQKSYDDKLRNQVNWYSSRPDYIQRTTSRATRYLYYVVQELEKRGMPTELALLPFIESAFNPQAFSSAQAAGMWQFIPSTGRDYNLKQNMFNDDRRSVLASTDAALTYLQRLYGMFGDWQLALAAYNWGEGNVSKLVRRNQLNGRPTDYNSMSAMMPVETRNYVPKLQAVKNIIAHPEQYNIALPRLDNQPYFTTVGKTRDIDVKLAAQLAEMPMDEFKALNPQYNRPVIIGSEKTELLLPKENADKFKINLAQWGRTLSSWTTHTITNAREKIETLAAKFSTTPEVIREANNIPPKMRLRAGSTILVPKAETAQDNNITAEVADNAKMMIEPDVADTRKVMFKVGKRDNLASIASRYKVSVADIKMWNGLQRDQLSNGQRLQLQVPVLAKHHASHNTRHAANNKQHSRPTVLAHAGKHKRRV